MQQTPRNGVLFIEYIHCMLLSKLLSVIEKNNCIDTCGYVTHHSDKRCDFRIYICGGNVYTPDQVTGDLFHSSQKSQ